MYTLGEEDERVNNCELIRIVARSYTKEKPAIKFESGPNNEKIKLPTSVNVAVQIIQFLSVNLVDAEFSLVFRIKQIIL